MFKPLEGVRVLDLTQVLAGPYATYQLALLGADVTKIEPPERGDWARAGPALPEHAGQNMGVNYLTQNANKKSVTLDLKTEEGQQTIRKLIAQADIFVENFRPGTAARLGLSFDDVKALRPDIIYCSISAFGQDGPMSHRPAYDHVIQGMCGIMTTTGTQDSGPTKVGAPYIDYVTGLNAAFAVLTAVLDHRSNPRAIQLDVAMLDSSLLLMASMMTQNLSMGIEHKPTGNEAFSASPSSGAFETKEGLLMLAANNERQFKALCGALGREDILQDERWSEPSTRAQNGKALRDELVATLKTETADEWELRLDKQAVPAARVRTLGEVLKEPQIQARGLMHQMTDPFGGSYAVPTLGFKVDGATVCPTTPPSALGDDTEEVLSRVAEVSS
ncbi:CoA transferase [Rhodobacteraceae bacterium D3-12]|nr:CoA transferase [Rhodobacteraceae bacterium D3-12]